MTGTVIAGIDPADATQILPPGADTADRVSWLQLRRTGIGSSEASALVGLSKYKGKFELWLDKTDRLPLVDEQPSREARWGSRLEPIVREVFAEEHGLDVVKPGTLRSTRWPWMLCDPDGLCSDGGGFEAKTTSVFAKKDWAHDQTSDHAELQSQWCMAVTGLKHWWVAVLIGGQDDRYRRIDRDDELIEILVEESRRFWVEHIQADVEPVPDGSDGCAELLKDLYRVTDPDSIVDIDQATWDEIDQARKRADAARKEAESDYRAVQNRVRKLLGDKERLFVGDAEVATWKPSATFAAGKFAKEHPELAEEYATTKTTATLDVESLRKNRPDLYEQYRTRVLTFK